MQIKGCFYSLSWLVWEALDPPKSSTAIPQELQRQSLKDSPRIGTISCPNQPLFCRYSNRLEGPQGPSSDKDAILTILRKKWGTHKRGQCRVFMSWVCLEHNFRKCSFKPCSFQKGLPIILLWSKMDIIADADRTCQTHTWGRLEVPWD